ncbi:conserved hypothetical signal peptide protein [Paraburkholderia atlantica]|uniref:Conserved hypothetical signal peptide protein n=1 Tax=Paraburkholderia atlantica TaxID=2654982 RepID=D5WAG7_PARAM|nr:hypothetical protein [Paraburkholderia atlantica]ADG16247.1 conserved hypothetical signal peptide protein [Paraburkholderia atlantica]
MSTRLRPSLQSLPSVHFTAARTALRVCACLCMGVAVLVAGEAHAQSPAVPVVGATATIGSGAGMGATGALSVNETAGLDNAQANQITVTKGGAVGNANTSVQSASVVANVPRAQASIEVNAFSNTSGAVLVNQSAGAGNLQRNSTQIGTAALGVETVSDGELSATAPKNGSSGQSNAIHSVREASISSHAFRNASGIVQINQAAGAGNATANSFVLRPPAGTFFN